MRAFALSVALSIVVAFALVTAAHGQSGPRYILVHGAGLAAPLLLDDQAQNAVLISAPTLLPRAGVPREGDRPVFELALFFEVPDLSGRNPEQLRPDETAARGRFFPAIADLEPIFELGAATGIGPRRHGGLTPEMLDYLVLKGVPVASEAVLPPPRPSPSPSAVVAPPTPPDDPEGSTRTWPWFLGIASALGAAAVVWFAARSRRRPRGRGIHF